MLDRDARPRRPALRVTLAAATAMTMVLAWSVRALAVPLVQISSDPYLDQPCQHAAEVEPDTFGFGDTVVSTFQVGRCFDGGAVNIGWATSLDDGATWTHGLLPGLTVAEGGDYARASDASVAYDSAHDVWMISSLGIQTNPVRALAVLISTSNDGGLTWNPPVVAATGNNLDKNWSVCDNSAASQFAGNCYTEYDDNSAGNRLKMITSSDGGSTWSAPQDTADHASGLGGQPVVGPDGTVVVPYDQGSTFSDVIRAFHSSDGGATWSATALISAAQRRTPSGGIRAPDLPSAEVDAAGTVYVAWYDCRFRAGCPRNDIVFSSSADGVAWSGVARVPIDDTTSTVDHFTPGLGVDSSTSGDGAHLALSYYFYPDSPCTAGTCRLTAGYISSPDGGATWTDPVQLTDTAMSLAWLPNTSQGRMVADYLSTSYVADGTAHPVIAVANEPGTLLDQGMYTPLPGLSARAGAAHRSSKDDRPQPPAAAPADPGVPITAR